MANKINDFFGKKGVRYTDSIAPDRVEKICGYMAIVLLIVLVTAIYKGQEQFSLLPGLLWFHLITIALILAITPIMMLRTRGDKYHRWLGWTWCILMFATALASIEIRLINDGGFSFIHILTVVAIISVPVAIISARRHDIRRHRSHLRGFIIGALILAGFFSFPFNRLLGNWLFG